jgi:hypothetical protein
VRNLLEALGPVVAAAGEDLDRLVGQVDLSAVAVELDFANPALSRRHLLDRGGQGRLDEAGQRRLDADRLRFFTLKRHPPTPRNTEDSKWHRWIRSGTGESFAALHLHRSPKAEPMAAAKKKTARGRKQDRARVAGGQKHEVRYEAKKSGRSASAVKKAVKKVGNSRKRVEKRLGR